MTKGLDKQHCRRIKLARERLRLEPQEIADVIGINAASYWDLEMDEDEIASTASLKQIITLCNLLKLSPSKLFTGASANHIERQLTVQELVQLIPNYITTRQITLARFENKVGWKIEEILASPKLALEQWGLDCLCDICDPLDID